MPILLRNTAVPTTGFVTNVSQQRPKPDAASGHDVVLPSAFGRYRVWKQVSFGRAPVYLAHDIRRDRAVALRVISCCDPDDAILDRIYADVMRAVELRHTAICPVFEINEVGSQHFISMAFVDGQPLSEFMHDRPMPIGAAVRIVRTVASALLYAHENELTHGLLTPESILITTRRQPIVINSGLRALLNVTSRGERLAMQLSGAEVSTVYLAPELRADPDLPVTPAADIYSLGIILFELLTGHQPDHEEMSLQGLSAQPHRTAVPDALDNVCRRMTADDPVWRYAHLRSVLDDLAAAGFEDNDESESHAETRLPQQSEAEFHSVQRDENSSSVDRSAAPVTLRVVCDEPEESAGDVQAVEHAEGAVHCEVQQAVPEEDCVDNDESVAAAATVRRRWKVAAAGGVLAVLLIAAWLECLSNDRADTDGNEAAFRQSRESGPAQRLAANEAAAMKSASSGSDLHADPREVLAGDQRLSGQVQSPPWMGQSADTFRRNPDGDRAVAASGEFKQRDTARVIDNRFGHSGQRAEESDDLSRPDKTWTVIQEARQMAAARRKEAIAYLRQRIRELQMPTADHGAVDRPTSETTDQTASGSRNSRRMSTEKVEDSIAGQTAASDGDMFQAALSWLLPPLPRLLLWWIR